MSAPNRNTLWAETLVEELADGGLSAVCLTPGSRSTPLTLAFTAHPDIEIFSHLDERCAAYFALGRGRRTGSATAVLTTSGTATANLHPAVMEANEGRVPLLVLTADRPPELTDSGANQTTDQHDLYGDGVRYSRTLPEPEVTVRKLRSLRVTAGRALAKTRGSHPGPVHLDVPFPRPLEPTPVPDDVPESPSPELESAIAGRSGPAVTIHEGTTELDAAAIDPAADELAGAGRGLLVCGPADQPTPAPDALRELARATGFPVLADPLSGHRFGPLVDDITVCGGYDSYLDAVAAWPDPEVVVRFGAAPTSKVLRQYLRGADCRQFLVDPAGGWPEAEFTATDLVVADPSAFATTLASAVAERTPGDRSDGRSGVGTGRGDGERTSGGEDWAARFERAESAYWDLLDAVSDDTFEGTILHTVADRCPAGATLFVSNSMPVRDLDRFGRPRPATLTVLGNRGVSGIDGIVSTALGAGSATDDPLVLVTGDVAFYHDMNGLLALSRCDLDATIVLVDNDGGGIFHMLDIEQFDPPFTDQFKTPHGLDFERVATLYDLEFRRFESLDGFGDTFQDSVRSPGTQLLSVEMDARESHRRREHLHDRVRQRIR